MISIITLLPLLAVLVSPVQAQTRYCYDRFGRVRRCSGLSYGARIGIGVGIAVAVLLIFGLCGFWRRRQIKHQFSKYQTPSLPFHHNNNNNNNPYANNPPPPNGVAGSQTNWNSNPYGNNPPPPAQTYQPSNASYYGNREGDKVNGHGTGAAAQNDSEHGYEWEQAREAERLERENGGAAPPGYDVAASQHNTGNTNNYAPPPGAPPGSKETPIVRNL